MPGLWYSLLHTSRNQSFSASLPSLNFSLLLLSLCLWRVEEAAEIQATSQLPRFFVHYGWSNSSRDTDPSAVSSFSWLCLWCSFLLGFSCTKRLKPACRWQWSKTDRFEQHDGTPFLITCGKHFGVTSLLFTLSPPCLVLVGWKFVSVRVVAL